MFALLAGKLFLVMYSEHVANVKENITTCLKMNLAEFAILSSVKKSLSIPCLHASQLKTRDFLQVFAMVNQFLQQQGYQSDVSEWGATLLQQAR